MQRIYCLGCLYYWLKKKKNSLGHSRAQRPACGYGSICWSLILQWMHPESIRLTEVRRMSWKTDNKCSLPCWVTITTILILSFTALNLDIKFRIQNCPLLEWGKAYTIYSWLPQKTMVRHLNISPDEFKLNIITWVIKLLPSVYVIDFFQKENFM